RAAPRGRRNPDLSDSPGKSVVCERGRLRTRFRRVVGRRDWARQHPRPSRGRLRSGGPAHAEDERAARSGRHDRAASLGVCSGNSCRTSAVTTFALSPPPTKLTLRLVFAAWRGITPAQLRTTFLLGLAFLLFGLVTGGSRGVGLRSVPFTF